MVLDFIHLHLHPFYPIGDPVNRTITINPQVFQQSPRFHQRVGYTTQEREKDFAATSGFGSLPRPAERPTLPPFSPTLL
jgi:hypothetical protein